MKTYVATYTGGYGDNHYFGILYAGTNLKKAKQSVLDFKFPDEYNNYGEVDVWQDGVLLKTIGVIM
jgi:hypothetical protein